MRRITPYFNPRSPHGERPKHGSTRIPGEDISIHAPCTGSDTERDTLKQQLDISIHAPCTGSDIFICPCPLYKPISIHAPCTGSDATLPHAYRQPRFQSTLPARGATFHELVVVQFVKFQSTLPARGATSPADGWQLPARISIHAPCTGSDAQLVRADGHLTISIHAPCTGSDYVEPSGLAVHTNFNPRSPHGERPAGSPPAMVSASYFNPRSPHGERHSSAPANTSPPGISIHAPRTGSDYTALLPPSSQWISIHAPRTGSDVCDSVLNSVDSLFQSTLPARGATFGILRCVADLKSFQSTLPARGATFGILRCVADLKSFQSTLPARGATWRMPTWRRKPSHFNPRSPHGERQG